CCGSRARRHFPHSPTRRSSDLRYGSAVSAAQLQPSPGQTFTPTRRVDGKPEADSGVSSVFNLYLVIVGGGQPGRQRWRNESFSRDGKSTRLNSSHVKISYAVFC